MSRPRTTAAYEAEVRKADGTEVDVALDKDLNVITQTPDAPDAPDADDRVLSATERASAEKAAQDAVGGGTILDVEAGDNGSLRGRGPHGRQHRVGRRAGRRLQGADQVGRIT